MTRKISDAGLALVKKFEGLRLESYRDCAGILTCGYGHTGPDVKEGMIITPGEAERLLQDDLSRFEAGVDAMTEGVPTSDCQFSAMVSLAYNIGLGKFVGSTVLKRHRLGNPMGAANAFLMWNRAGGQIREGLNRRREAERALYLGEVQ